MSLPVFWTDEATETFDRIVVLIENKWGQSSAAKFIKNVYRNIALVSTQPYLYKVGFSGARQSVITHQTSMFYEVTDERIIILFFYDTRQDPLFE